MTTYEKSALAAMWFSAIGTCGAVMYALFGAIMRRWFNTPKLEIAITDGFPHCALLKRSDPKVSNSDLDVIEICASLVNVKKWCAKNSRVMCNAIYVPEADGEKYCSFQKMRPQQFQWIDLPDDQSFSAIDIAQSVSHFVKIAEISKPQNIMSANESANKELKAGPASVTVAVRDGHGKAYIRIPFEHKSTLISIVCLARVMSQLIAMFELIGRDRALKNLKLLGN